MFVFDFAQNFEVPFYGSDQPQKTYYFSPLSINVFGVYDCDKGHMNAFCTLNMNLVRGLMIFLHC